MTRDELEAIKGRLYPGTRMDVISLLRDARTLVAEVERLRDLLAEAQPAIDERVAASDLHWRIDAALGRPT
jgi:hypothetical protein